MIVVAANSYTTLVIVLALSACGAIFSTSSRDMGVKGVLDRLLQIEPMYLFYDDQVLYNNKKMDLRSNIKAVVERMMKMSSFKGLIIIPRYPGRKDEELDFSQVPMWYVCKFWP